MREYRSDTAGGQEEAPGVTLPAITFTLDGEVFRCLTAMDADALLEWSELGAAASDDVPADSPQAAAYFTRFLRAAFGTQEYNRLRRHMRARGTRPEVLMAIISGIQEEMAATVETMTGRPTVPPSSSSPGDEGQAAGRAKLVSLARGEVTFADPPPPAGEAKEPGRKPAKRAASSGG